MRFTIEAVSLVRRGRRVSAQLGGLGLPAEILYLILSTVDKSFDSENLTTSLNGVSFTIS